MHSLAFSKNRLVPTTSIPLVQTNTSTCAHSFRPFPISKTQVSSRFKPMPITGGVSTIIANTEIHSLLSNTTAIRITIIKVML